MTAVAMLRQEESTCLPFMTSQEWFRLAFDRRWLRVPGSLEAEWVPPPLSWTDPLHEVPVQGPCDFAFFVPGSLAVSTKAVDALADLWPAVGELLPVSPDGVQNYSILNVTRVIPALNLEETKGLRGERGNFLSIRKHVFIDELVESEVVFRVPDQAAIYCTEELAERVHTAGLTGIWFKKVWRSRGPEGGA